jgi:hypothetical protein
LIAAAVVCTSAPLGFSPGQAPRSETDPLVFAQIPAGAAGDLPQGSRIVLLDPSSPDGEVIDLTPGFSAAGRPDLSFDGRRILFVARRAPADRLAVWELALGGGKPRLVTDRPANCTRAIYLSTLHTLNAAEPVEQIAFAVADGRSGPGHQTLYTCRMDGSRLRQITFNPHGASDPLLLSDGRLLYSSAGPPVAGNASALFTVNTDGTDVFVFADAHAPPAIRGMPCETDDGQVVYVESTDDARLGGGALVAVARARSLHTRRLVAAADDGTYHSPSALAGGRLLVSYRHAEGESYGIHVLDPRLGQRVGEVFDSPEWDEVEAVVVRRRRTPAGRSSVVDEQVDFGFLYCLDSYRTNLAPARDVDAGTIETLRVLGAAGEDETILGEAPVHPDGSVYLQLPAKTPLRLETLDGDGRVLQAMKSWIWVMPGERRGCIGCHADRELSPPNRHVLALRKGPLEIGLPQDGP